MDINNICLQFSKNSWHRRLNQYVYGKGYFTEIDWDIYDDYKKYKTWIAEHPAHISPYKDKKICLCPYFWGTTTAVIISPFAFMSYHWPKIHNPIQLSPETSAALHKQMLNVTIITVIIGGAYYTILIDWLPAAVLGLMAAVIAPSVYGIMYGIPWLDEHWPKWLSIPSRKKKPKKANILIEFIKANKKKVCPCIEWE